MAASMNGVLADNVQENVKKSKILVVGAGGIGCELLKNLVLTGFTDIETIDLDTIDVSNLNRQFLFRKEHVGKSKAQVAKESALNFNPDAKIVAYQDNVMSSEYDIDFFQKFDVVMNALDNRAARNHVNRMCLAADRPLIESGTAGYLGQVTVIKKGLTECYECIPKPPQKTFPGCTIRNTPSEPIHCVVWAKHLFNQLFGEEDPDQDVSPDTEDPELAAEAGQKSLETEAKEGVTGGIQRKSTRAWAQEVGYDGEKIFNKMFRDDIKYLLSMEALWKKRRAPTPLDWNNLPSAVENGSGSTSSMRDQRLWPVQECADVLSTCLSTLKEELHKQGDGGMLVWDKDDDKAMDFVVCAANIRAHIFGIAMKTKFDIKSMAGNIIPAIATTNAIIAAVIVMEGLKILSGQIEDCKATYLNRQPNPRKRLLVPCALDKPNPKCYVCALKPEVTVLLNTHKITVKCLEEKVLKTGLGMVAPDVEIDNGKGTILISSEEGETEDNNDKTLNFFGIQNKTVLKCDDFLQNYNLNVILVHQEKFEEEQEFTIVGDVSELQAQAEAETPADKPTSSSDQDTCTPAVNEIDEEELMIVEQSDEEENYMYNLIVQTNKRKLSDDEVNADDAPVAKKQKATEEDDDLICL